MKVAVLKESYPGEKRVALVPMVLPSLTKQGWEVIVESGAGDAAGYTDQQFQEKGALITDQWDLLFTADVLVQVRACGANREEGHHVLQRLGPQHTVIGMCDPLGAADAAAELAPCGATTFALELIPRITRAQSMDILSSMATVAGYRAVLLAATHLPRMFPLMMTAAGTLAPAKALVLGAGVAGLQAIATCRRLGAVVHGYDVRPAVRDQVESLGGKFVELALDTQQAEDKGGYAKVLGDEFYNKQRELLAHVVAESDVVISTAAIPGKPSPLLITEDAVRRMSPGSVIVDLAAERGGNCQCTEADKTITAHGVTILGPTNLSSDVPFHASQMYAKNVCNFLLNCSKKGELCLDLNDAIVRDTLMTRNGEVVNAHVRDILGLPPLPAADVKVENKATAENNVLQK